MQDEKLSRSGRGHPAAQDLRSDAEGNTVLLRRAAFGPAELWEWGLDAEGQPYERYQWCEDDLYEDSSYRKCISKEELIETLKNEASQIEQNGDPDAAKELRSILERLAAEA